MALPAHSTCNRSKFNGSYHGQRRSMNGVAGLCILIQLTKIAACLSSITLHSRQIREMKIESSDFCIIGKVGT